MSCFARPKTLTRLLRPSLEVSAHCDLPCGVYDPAQARIEAESVKAICEKYPQLHELFNEATKLAGAAGGKGTVDPGEAEKLLQKIAEIDKIFWETKQA
jgi:nickel superoxide dismutase